MKSSKTAFGLRWKQSFTRGISFADPGSGPDFRVGCIAVGKQGLSVGEVSSGEAYDPGNRLQAGAGSAGLRMVARQITREFALYRYICHRFVCYRCRQIRERRQRCLTPLMWTIQNADVVGLLPLPALLSRWSRMKVPESDAMEPFLIHYYRPAALCLVRRITLPANKTRNFPCS